MIPSDPEGRKVWISSMIPTVGPTVPISLEWVRQAKCPVPECNGGGRISLHLGKGEYELMTCPWCRERDRAIS
jgi:hypothetical protein